MLSENLFLLRNGGSELKAPSIMLSSDELMRRKNESIVLPSLEAIEYFDKEHPETIDFSDLSAVLAIHNDPRQSHRFDQLKGSPREFFDDVVMDEKVTVYFARDPETGIPISTVSITNVRGGQLETWLEHAATAPEYHGRGVFGQLMQGALYKTVVMSKVFDTKFNEQIHAGVILDGDHGPMLKTLIRFGFVPILRHVDQMGSPTNAVRITQVIAQLQKGSEIRHDTLRLKLPATVFLEKCVNGDYPFLNRIGKSKELYRIMEADGIYMKSLEVENQQHVSTIDISDNIRGILDPLGI